MSRIVTTTARIADIVRRCPGMTSREIAARLHIPSPCNVATLCRRLERRGLLQRVPTSGGVGDVQRWAPTATLRKGYTGQTLRRLVKPEVQAWVEAASGPLTIAQIAEQINAPKSAVWSAVTRLVDEGAVRTETKRIKTRPFFCTYVMRPVEPLEDDGWTPPTHYIGGTRAKILGLRPGRAA